MAKTFNAYEKATIKRTAAEVARLRAKEERLLEKIEEINKQISEIEDTISQYDGVVDKITGGFSSLQLCEKVARAGGSQMDWVFKYPDTIVPVVEDAVKTAVDTEPVYPTAIEPAVVEEKEEEKEEEEKEEENLNSKVPPFTEEEYEDLKEDFNNEHEAPDPFGFEDGL